MNERHFLNLPEFHSLGAIRASVRLNNYSDNENKALNEEFYGIDTELSISDCGKIINLSLEYDTPEEYANSIRKLEILEQTITSLKRNFIKGYEIYKDLKAKRSEKHETNKEELVQPLAEVKNKN
jgi:hypothetical protein